MLSEIKTLIQGFGRTSHLQKNAAGFQYSHAFDQRDIQNIQVILDLPYPSQPVPQVRKKAIASCSPTRVITMTS